MADQEQSLSELIRSSLWSIASVQRTYPAWGSGKPTLAMLHGLTNAGKPDA